MKLVFSKSEESEISVHKLSNGNKTDFNYVDMIKALIKDEKLVTPELNGDFSDAEKESINSMINHINSEVAHFYYDEED